MSAPKLTLAAAALLAAPAYAGNPIEPAPEPVPMAPVPVVAPGVDWTGPSIGLQLGYGDVTTDGAADLSGDGALYGLRAYYDYDFGDWILGGGLQYDFADIDLDGAATLNAVARAGIRGGYDLGRNWIYATGGWARAMTDDDAVDPGDSDGYFAGLGYEGFVTDNLTAGVEVLYHEFKDFDIDDLDAEATTVNVSLNYRF
ncbi:porin family protein [Thalassococcus sp. CAU 1522]|uniref:Porin family protein n=1 Tax=Thalassococcus arenae TaxID=2851652 RepID=A0ABS6N7N8_9RHOB|nr:outer membrane beta-barrel protein [Thalassococcus arenae]MBV2360026.1 porin family protein [Thalassococcus arenae]